MKSKQKGKKEKKKNEKKKGHILTHGSGYKDDDETHSIDENESSDKSGMIFCCNDLQLGYNPVFVMVCIPQSFYAF